MQERKKRNIDQKFSLHDGDFADSIINIFEYPSELAESIERLRETLTHPQLNKEGLSDIEFILRRLEHEARRILKTEGFPTGIKELETINDYQMGIPAGSARNVLFEAQSCRADLQKGDAQAVFFDMLFLVSSVFKMDAFDLALLGSRSYFKKIYAGKSDKRAKGIVLLVITILKGGADLRLKKYQAQLAWDAIKRRYDSYCPLSLPGYEFYIDGAKLIEVTAETDEQEEKTRAITFKTFQRYFYEALKKKSQ